MDSGDISIAGILWDLKEVFSVANNDDDEMKHVDVVVDDVIVLILFPRLAVTAEANNGIDSPKNIASIVAMLYND